jgi:hypothetical protein
MAQQQELFFETERWGKFELELHGPADGEDRLPCGTSSWQRGSSIGIASWK